MANGMIDRKSERIAQALYEHDHPGQESWSYWLGWPCGGSHTANKYYAMARAIRDLETQEGRDGTN